MDALAHAQPALLLLLLPPEMLALLEDRASSTLHPAPSARRATAPASRAAHACAGDGAPGSEPAAQGLQHLLALACLLSSKVLLSATDSDLRSTSGAGALLAQFMHVTRLLHRPGNFAPPSEPPPGGAASAASAAGDPPSVVDAAASGGVEGGHRACTVPPLEPPQLAVLFRDLEPCSQGADAAFSLLPPGEAPASFLADQLQGWAHAQATGGRGAAAADSADAGAARVGPPRLHSTDTVTAHERP